MTSEVLGDARTDLLLFNFQGSETVFEKEESDPGNMGV